jgi:hypothetical protein
VGGAAIAAEAIPAIAGVASAAGIAGTAGFIAGGAPIGAEADAVMQESAEADTGVAASAESTLKPGPYANRSIPARGPGRDVTSTEREQIDIFGREDGCHTCGSQDPGTKSGHFVPDHQPLNQLNPSGGPQRLYPQCLACSRRRGGQIRGLMGW